MNISFPGRGIGRRPKALCCYICGREYGTNSLRIHIPQCQKLWIQREELKPKHERRPIPRAPIDIERALGGFGGDVSASDVQAYNDTAFRTFTDEALVPCDFCGRKFLPEKLIVHNRSCTKERPAARVMARVATQQQQHAQTLSPSVSRRQNETTSLPLVKPQPMPLSARGAAGSMSGEIVRGKNCGPNSSFEQDKRDKLTLSSPTVTKSAEHLTSTVVDHETESKNASHESDKPSQKSVRFDDNDVDKNENVVGTVKNEEEQDSESFDTDKDKGRKASHYDFESNPNVDQSSPTELVPCNSCQRSFAADRIQKHERVCKGPAENKLRRTQYDPRKAIAEADSRQGENESTAKWKREHEEFQAAIRMGRLAEKIRARGGNIAKELPPPPPSENPDYISCPYCSRRFNQEAAERHIHHCRTAVSRPRPNLRAGAGLGGGAAGASRVSGGGIGIVNASRYVDESRQQQYQQQNHHQGIKSPYKQSNVRSMNSLTPHTSNYTSPYAAGGHSSASPSPRRSSINGSEYNRNLPSANVSRNTPSLGRSSTQRQTGVASPPMRRMTTNSSSIASPITSRSSGTSSMASPSVQRMPSGRALPPLNAAGSVGSPLRGIARNMGFGMSNSSSQNENGNSQPKGGALSPVMRSPTKSGSKLNATSIQSTPKSPQSTLQRFCTGCGEGRTPSHRFCGGCGERFSE